MGSHAGQTHEANKKAKTIRRNSNLSAVRKKALIDKARRLDPDFGSLGIVIDGNYSQKSISPAQQKSLTKLLSLLKDQLDIPSQNIIGHKHVKEKVIEAHKLTFAGKTTSCPGHKLEKSLPHLKSKLPPDTEAAIKKYGYKEKHIGFGEELSQAWKKHSIKDMFNLGISYYRRKLSLRNPKAKDFKNVEKILDGKTDILEQKLGREFRVGRRSEFPDRYFYPKIINLNSTKARFGFRNRGDYSQDILKTHGLLIPLAHRLKSPQKLKRERGVHKNTTVIGLDTRTGKILVGVLNDFLHLKTARLSKTTRNNIREIPMQNGNVVKKRARYNNWKKYKYYSPTTITNTGRRGSLPILFKGKNGPNKLGSTMGGSFIFQSKDKKRTILVSGTANQIATAFKLFKGKDSFATIYNLDNGTYTMGFQTKSKILKKQQLRRYDLRNSSGGHGLYLKTSN